jgi:hypothetical protein
MCARFREGGGIGRGTARSGERKRGWTAGVQGVSRGCPRVAGVCPGLVHTYSGGAQLFSGVPGMCQICPGLVQGMPRETFIVSGGAQDVPTAAMLSSRLSFEISPESKNCPERRRRGRPGKFRGGPGVSQECPESVEQRGSCRKFV